MKELLNPISIGAFVILIGLLVIVTILRIKEGKDETDNT